MTGSIRCVVFSRDRALQLDAFLESLERFAPLAYETIAVLYRATGPLFAQAYDELRRERPLVAWLEESSFRDDLLGALGTEPYLVFHTDDDVFFDAVPAFELREDEVCFTLRLGLNTTYCYPLDVEERLQDAEAETERVSWSWRDQAPGAYSYPLALNGHVFRANDARDWLQRIGYTNPNELESSLQALGDDVPARMASFPRSRVVSIPTNIVNETFPNRHAGGRDVGGLNDRFLRGERIDTEAMDFANVTACHQEIELKFTGDR